MKNIILRAVSLILTLALTIGLSVIVAADEENVKIDFTTREAFDSNAYVTLHIPTEFRPDPYTAGKYEFSEANGAVRLDYRATANVAPYRLMFGFDTPQYLKADYKFMTVVYAAKTTAPYRMSLWNSPKNGYESVIAENGKDTGGKFVISEPVDISLSANSVSNLTRFTAGTHNTLSVTTEDKEAAFYIKEITFHKSAEAAKAYYAGVSFPGLKAESEGAVSERTVKDIDRVIVSLRSKSDFTSVGMFYTHKPTDAEPDPNTAGVYSFNESEQALELIYAKTAKYNPWRTWTHLNKAGLTKDYKYLVVVYKAESKEPYTMTLWNGGHWGKEVKIAGDSKVTGEYVISPAFDISEETKPNESVLTRWSRGSFNNLSVRCADPEARFFIKEFGFFKSAADAAEYYSKVDINKHPSEYAYTEEELLYGVLPDTLPEPYIMNFGQPVAALLRDGIKMAAGTNQVQTADGTWASKIAYDPVKGLTDFRAYPMTIGYDKLSPHYRYVRVTYMSNDSAISNLTISDAAGVKPITLTTDISQSGGKWVTTNAAFIAPTGLISEMNDGLYCKIETNSTDKNTEIYIKEIAFFATEEQAYKYYGDSYRQEEIIEYAEMTFGEDSNAAFFGSGDTVYGIFEQNSEDSTLDIKYSPDSNISATKYQSKIKFGSLYNGYNASYNYVRVYYKANNPEGAENVKLRLRNDKSGADYIDLVENVVTTDGYVLSDVKKMSDDMSQRFAGTGAYKGKMHNSIFFTTLLEGGLYKIKTIYFFKSERDALAFTPPRDTYDIRMNGNSLNDYVIVLSEDAAAREKEAAQLLNKEIRKLTGEYLEIVTDKAAKAPLEIIIGNTNRTEDDRFYGEGGVYTGKYSTLGAYEAAVSNNTIVFASNIPYSAYEMVGKWCESYLSKDKADENGVISLDGTSAVTGATTNMSPRAWESVNNTDMPAILEDSFDTDNGTWVEEGTKDNFALNNGTYTSNGANSLSYIHTYERNAVFTAKLTTETASSGEFGLMLRYNSDHAYVKAGYDVEKGVYYIEERSGEDFRPVRASSAKAELIPGKAYTFELTANGASAELTVDGQSVVKADGLIHVTPGRVAVYSDDCKIAVDDVRITFLSGEGTVIPNVTHTKLPDEKYREGGSVTEMRDGTLIYHVNSGDTFASSDSGKTWTRRDTWTETTGYSNIFRLANGNLLKIMLDTVDGESWRTAKLSSDDGKTWRDGGKICTQKYTNQPTMSAGNMNDKITQMSDGRIFYVQNYQEQGTALYKGYISVFCEIYYSDDNGMTWTKSEMDTYDIPGNEKMGYFGECKVIETTDGLRLYNSWSDYDYVAYSDSYDNGVTWGELKLDTSLPTGRASMQIVKDEYADGLKYYMLTVNDNRDRTRLTMFTSNDGMNWSELGDIWRWEAEYKHDGSSLYHIVDPFIKTTADYVICGSGISERAYSPEVGGSPWHQSQRQHIWSIPKSSLTAAEKLYKFTDVTTKDAYYESVKYAVDAGLFNGTSDTTFSPASPMTRAMFVTVLGRLAKADVAAYATPTFNDVIAGQWYTSYVEWAAANGIVNGLGNCIYGINDNVTIQQACVILARYADYKVAASQTGKVAADFADGASVATWAAKEVDWALANGIYAPTGNLNPTSPASRATVATMFANYVKAYGA